MSASNWNRCPKCAALKKLRQDELREGIAASYGKVSIDEFSAMQKELASLDRGSTLFIEATLREDYEIYGADEGSIEVCYSASCDACGLKISFDHLHEVDVS